VLLSGPCGHLAKVPPLLLLLLLLPLLLARDHITPSSLHPSLPVAVISIFGIHEMKGIDVATPGTSESFKPLPTMLLPFGLKSTRYPLSPAYLLQLLACLPSIE
jgi:hypothetical protein